MSETLKQKGITGKEAAWIDRLQRRAEHLRGRIAAGEADGRDLNYDRAEMSALLWAIPILEGAAHRPDVKLAAHRYVRWKKILFAGQTKFASFEEFSKDYDASVDRASAELDREFNGVLK